MVKIVVMLLLAAAVAHADPAKPWLYLPGKPTAETIRFAKKQTSARYLIKQSPDVYVVAFIQLGHSKDLDADVMLDKAVETSISTVSATIVAGPSKPSFANARAREVVAKLANGSTVTMRFVIADDVMYVLYVGDTSAFDADGALRTPKPDDGNIYGGLVGDSYGTGGIVGGGGIGTLGSGRAKQPTTMPSIGQPTTSGGELDRAIIRRYIKRNLDKIADCYERELTKKPKLAGTVKAEFVISANGMVSNAKASGVDTKVAECIAGVIKNIQFPKPRDGKDVNVSYPLTFRPPDKK